MKPSTHQKHTKLTRPALGHFARNEFAILGTPCGNIKMLARELVNGLSESYKVAYVDADHKSADAEAEEGRDPNSMLGRGGNLEFTDKITFSRFDFDGSFNGYEQKPLYNGQDLVLVNGNHFLAKHQIAVIDPKKPLEKKLHKLTSVKLILLKGDSEEIPGYLKAHLGNWESIPVLAFDDRQGIIAFIEEEMKNALPPLKALILAGGKSQRMQQDKAHLDYHGMPQYKYLTLMFEEMGIEARLSCRPDQIETFSDSAPLADTFAGLGPFGGILSAFREEPDTAWMVVACDLPLLSKESLSYLIENRDPSSVATAFNSPQNEFPEPLITIWEPRSYPVLLHFLSMGYSCPRKALINSQVKLLDVPEKKDLTNVNYPEEYEQVKAEIGS